MRKSFTRNVNNTRVHFVVYNAETKTIENKIATIAGVYKSETKRNKALESTLEANQKLVDVIESEIVKEKRSMTIADFLKYSEVVTPTEAE